MSREAVPAPSQPSIGTLRIGRIYRYARPYGPTPAEIDGLPNFFAHVASSGMTLPTLERGINAMRAVAAGEGGRRAAILISSSPHKVGSDFTPWQDTFEPDLGFVRYYGDNKSSSSEPQQAPGNEVLLHEFQLHSSPIEAQRLRATPLVLFERVTVEGRQKGNVKFAGLAVIERAECVTQFNPATQEYFTNYVFEFAVLSLTRENDCLDWSWVAARRDAATTLETILRKAPLAWQEWVRFGNDALPRLRRHVSRVSVVPTSEQRPDKGSREDGVLKQIYGHYTGRKCHFEALASSVAAQVLSKSGTIYREGWITPGSGDHGTDFVGRLTIGSGFASVKLVVLGQAKCESLTSPTGGVHVARTVARLRRGWIGAYVTTSYFSEPVQREVFEDQYPIVLVHGRDVAQTAVQLAHEGGHKEVDAYLSTLDERYESLISHRRPEEILFD
jgi:Restriction endonuclease AspBHI N-terminal/Restriction endonuclease